MSDARRYAVWPDPRSRSRSLKGSRPSVPHGTNFFQGKTGLVVLRRTSGDWYGILGFNVPLDTVWSFRRRGLVTEMIHFSFEY